MSAARQCSGLKVTYIGHGSKCHCSLTGSWTHIGFDIGFDDIGLIDIGFGGFRV